MEFSSRKSIARAKTLRKDMTRAEKKLWYELKAKRLWEVKFRRQHPVAPYILDFACVKYRVAIEIDGETHGSPEEIDYDNRRTKFLESKGWTVIRFRNHEIFKQMTDVIDKITRHLPSTALAGEVDGRVSDRSEGVSL